MKKKTPNKQLTRIQVNFDDLEIDFSRQFLTAGQSDGQVFLVQNL